MLLVCARAIAPRKPVLSAAGLFSGARNGKTSGTRCATALNAAGAKKIPRSLIGEGKPVIEVPNTRPWNGVWQPWLPPIHPSTNRAGVCLCASPRSGVSGRVCWLERCHLGRRPHRFWTMPLHVEWILKPLWADQRSLRGMRLERLF